MSLDTLNFATRFFPSHSGLRVSCARHSNRVVTWYQFHTSSQFIIVNIFIALGSGEFSHRFWESKAPGSPVPTSSLSCIFGYLPCDGPTLPVWPDINFSDLNTCFLL